MTQPPPPAYDMNRTTVLFISELQPMNLANIIQDRTNDGITIVDFLFAVMRNELDGFKPCHRLGAAKLLVKYELDEALDFTLDNPPEPSRRRSDSGSSSETEFDNALAKVIRESTDDGRSVCRFLINVMDGDLSAFKPHHRISAARELLTRGFGKHAREESRSAYAHPSSPAPHSSSPAPHPSFPRKRESRAQLRPAVRQPSLSPAPVLQKSPRSPSRQPRPTPKRKNAWPRSMR